MEFRIADTFTSSLLKLTGQEQKAVKTTAFDLQLNPANPGIQLHKLDRAKDSNFWSARVNKDIRLIIHRTDESLLLCYVDHHDNAYAWASRRKIEMHPKTGATQLVEIRETVEEVVIQQPIAKSTESPEQTPLFAQISDSELLSYGIPSEWLKDIRSATEDTLFEITGHLAQEAAEALVELATGGKPKRLIPLPADINPFEHPDAQHRFQAINNVEELERALAYSWEDGTALLPSQPKLSGIPYFYPRDLGSATFVGREDEFEQLHQLLQGPQRVGIVALTGMGGVGKTELAWQYADRYSKSYPGGIWWLSGAHLVGDALTCGTRMGLAAAPEELQTHEAQVQWYYDRWVESIPTGLRLLIWDDVTDYGQLRSLLPQDERFRVLLTTRAKLGSPVQRLDLRVLKQGETLNLLRCLVGDGERIDAEIESAQDLCQWLGYLPLGIELVGRHLAGRSTLRLQTLLERLNSQRLNAQAIQQVPSEISYKENLKAAFELSWQLLNDTSKQVGCLLSIFALAPVKPEWVTASFPEWDAEVVEEAVETLFRWSLLTLDHGQYLLDPVIHEFFAYQLNHELSEVAENLRRSMAKAMVLEAKAITQPLTLTQLVQVQATTPHWQVVADNLTTLLEGIDVLWSFTALARVAMSQNHWLEAEKWCRACLRKSEERFGETHQHTADSLDILAGLYETIGRYAEALPLYERALVICEREVGVDHPDTAITLNNLAVLHYLMGHYESALPLYERSLAIRENKLGRTHPDTAERTFEKVGKS